MIVTRNRQKSLLRTLYQLSALEGEYPIVVVDNASEDNSAAIVRNHFPKVNLIALEHNHGAVARNIGVEYVDQPYVAFSDDDSWWAYGSLSQAIDLLDLHPKLGLIMSKILIEPEGRYDPCCQSMEASCLPNTYNLPGVPILGFIACGAVIRRSAFWSAGGFNDRFGTWGEEALLSVDMVKNGWGLSYINSVVSHHYPVKARDFKPIKIQEIRNTLWTCWMRRSPLKILKVTGKYVKDAFTDREVLAGVTTALQGANWVMQKRDPVPRWLEHQLELNDSNRGNC